MIIKSFSYRRAVRSLCLLLFGLVVFAGLLSTFEASHDKVAASSTASTLSFQARLMGSSGNIVADGNYNIDFKIYNSSSAGTQAVGTCSSNCLWEESYVYSGYSGATSTLPGPQVTVKDGYLSVYLGQYTSFPSTINWEQPLWITMNIGGTTNSGAITWDGEMSPRIQLTAIPYAFIAGQLAADNGGARQELQFNSSATGNDVITLPDATGTVCLDNTTSSSTCGFVDLQGASPTAQTGTNDNFDIAGSGIAGVSLSAPLITASIAVSAPLLATNNTSAGSTPSAALTIQSGNATGSSSNTGSITIASGSSSSGTAGSISIDSGAGGVANGSITIGGTNATGVTLGRTGLVVSAPGGLSTGTSAITSGLINGQTISSTANFTGTLNVAGVATVKGASLALGTGSSISGSIVLQNSTNNNTITLTTGATTGSYSLSLPTSAPAVGLCLQTSSASSSQLVFNSCANTNASITEVGEWDTNGTNSSTASTTLSVTPVNVGDELVYDGSLSKASDTITGISGGGVTTWTRVNALAGNGTANRVEEWMGTVTTTGSSSITVTYNSFPSAYEDAVTEFTAVGVGAFTTWGIDSSSTQLNASASTTISYPSITSEGNAEVYIGYADPQNAGSAGSSTGFSYIVTGANNVITYATPTLANTAYAPTATEVSGESNTVAGILTVFVSSTAINNSVSVQQANFNVQADTSGSVAGVLEANGSGTGDILDLRNGSGTNVVSVGYTGNTLIEPSTNTTTAFQVDNASGTSVLDGDTTNSRIGIDNSSASMAIPVISAHSTATTGGTLAQNTTYYYEITAVDAAGGETTPSTPQTTQLTGNTTATNTITLTWAPVTGAAGYHIYRSTTSGVFTSVGYYSTVGTVSGANLTFTDTNGTKNNTVATPPTTNTAYKSTNNSSNNLQLSIGGIGTPTGQLYVSGTLPTAATGSVPTGGSSQQVAVEGSYAYTANLSSSTLGIYNVSTPSAPVNVGSISTGTSSFPDALSVQGNYAYVLTESPSSLKIYNISNPSAPVASGSVTINSTGYGIYVQGNYAYIVNYTTNDLSIYNISNPAAPYEVGSISTGASTSPVFIYVKGNYAYVTDSVTSVLAIYNVSNPYAPVLAGSVSTGTSSTPQGVYVQGSYAYVADDATSVMAIISVSNPTSPVLINSISTGTSSTPIAVNVSGRYAYVSDSATNNISAFDISNPAAPVSLGTVSTGTSSAPNSIASSGRYIYVTDPGTTSLAIYDMGGAYVQQLQAGSTEVSSLQVDSNANVAGDLALQGGLVVSDNIEGTGNLGITGGSVLQGSTLLSGGANQLTAPTGLTVTPTGTTGATGYSYSVTAINASGGETQASTVVPTTTGNATLTTGNYNALSWTAVPGATGYKVYRTASSGTPSTTGLIGSSTTNSFSDTGLAGAGNTAPTVNTTAQLTDEGSALFENATNSTIAFQVANAAGTNILTVDTTDQAVGINATPSTQFDLTVGGTAPNTAGGAGEGITTSLTSASTYQYGLNVQPNIAPTSTSTQAFGALNFTPTSSSNLLSGGSITGVNGDVYYSGTGTLGASYGIYIQNHNASTGTETANDDIVLANPSNTGTIATNTALEIGYQTAGTTNYAIYAAGSGATPILGVTGTGQTTFENATNSTTAFNINNATGASQLNVDTTDDNVNIGASLYVTGLANPAIPTLTSSGSGGSLTAGSYYYAVAAFNAQGAPTEAINSNPSFVTTTGSSSKNTLTWTAVSGASGYYIYRATSPTALVAGYIIVSPGTLSIVDNGSTYSWTTTVIPPFYGNYTTGINIQSGAYINLDGGANNAGINYDPVNSTVAISNDYVGGVELLQASSLEFEDTTTFQVDFGINSIGQTLFENNTNSTSAFTIDNSVGSSIFNADTTNDILTLGTATNNVTFNPTTTSPISCTGDGCQTKKIVLTPEYAGAVLDTGSQTNITGTMTSGFDSTQRESFYQWTTAQSSNQTYDVVVQIPVPSDFKAWASTTPITVDIKTSNTTNGTVKAALWDTSGTIQPNWTYASNVPGCSLTPGTTSWTTVTGCTISGGTYTANGVMTLRIRLQAPTGGTTELGNINLSYTSTL